MIPFREKPKVSAEERKKLLRDLRALYGKQDLKDYREKINFIISSKSPILIVEALNVISHAKDISFLPTVTTILNEKDELPVIQIHALQTLFDLKGDEAKSEIAKFLDHENLGLSLTSLILLYLIDKQKDLLKKIETVLEDDYDYYFLATLMMNTFDSYIDWENEPEVLRLLTNTRDKADKDSDFYAEASVLLDEHL